MKKLFAIAFLFVASISVSFAQGVLKFSKDAHDFGKLEEGPTPATYSFEVTNTGNTPVVISNAQASCGCTTPDWSKAPIMPGQKSVIKVGYNTQGRVGAFTKTITVTSNAENATTVLTIRGEVAAAKGAVAATPAVPAVPATPAAIKVAKPAKTKAVKKAA